MGSRRLGLGSNRTPEEARRELTLPVLLVLVDAARLDFGFSTVGAPAKTVFIRRSTRTTDAVRSWRNLNYGLEGNSVAINDKQWETAVRPVLEQYIDQRPILQAFLDRGLVQQALDILGAALAQSFKDAGYGVGTGPTTPDPVPFVPTDLTGLLGWFDASDSSTITLEGPAGVRRWENKTSGIEYNASQQVLADQPAVVSADLNGLDVVSFDGTSDHLTMPFPVVSDWSCFLVGKFLTTGGPRGTYLAATGFDGSFGGPDLRIEQDGSVNPSGSCLTAIGAAEVNTTAVLADDTYGLLEWHETLGAPGLVEVGVSGATESLYVGDTSNDGWDSSRQLFGESPPLLAALGRRNSGINGASSFDYLEGSLAELVFYIRVLSSEERTGPRDYLRTKWGLP